MRSLGYVVHVKTPGIQGGEIRSYQVAQALAELGAGVHLYGDLDLSFSWHPQVVPHRLQNPAPRGLWQLYRSFSANQLQVVIQRYQFPIFNIGFFAGQLRRYPTILEIHGFPIDEYAIQRKRKDLTTSAAVNLVSSVPHALAMVLQRRIFQNIAHFIVTSAGTKAILIEYGVPSQRVTVVYNCVDPRLFNPIPTQQRMIRQQLGLPTGRQIVLYAGSLFHEELGVILQATRRVLTDTPSMFLLYVGKGNTAPLVDAAQKVGLSPQEFAIRPPVPHHQMPDLLAASDVVLAAYSLQSPRFQQAFHYSPLKIMEALAMNKAVVTVNAAELQQKFGHLPNAHFVQSGSSSSWAQGIIDALRMAQSPDLQAGRSYIMAGHRWQDAARTYLDIVDSVTSLSKRVYRENHVG